ncbi:MAG: short-chain dehydrogenase [Betaproteobacteria bacterium]|nr:SDR family oxidoreductase [Rhodocyclaceae bacterium]
MTKPQFGLDDDALAGQPTVYRPGLFADRVVLISGAGSGIGKAIAFLFARLGAKLAICGRDLEKLQATAPRLRELGSPDVFVQSMTIRDPEQVDALMDAVWTHFGQLDVLVNNAGGQFPKAAIELSGNGWRAVVDTNLNGTWYMMQAAAKRWRDHGQPGNIVNIVLPIDRGTPGAAHTGAARAGVIYLAKTVAVEWAPYDIRVNCVAPGTIESSGFQYYPPAAVERFRYSNPMKRTGSVHDIAEAVVYLAAPSGKFVNGETLIVDGGSVLWGDLWVTEKPDYFKV